MAGTNLNRIYNSGNSVASATVDGSQVMAFLEGLPLGVTATGEVFVKTGLAGSGTAAQSVSISAQPGAANQATGQVATSTSAATLVAARPARRSVTIKNTDTTIAVYVGPATVTTANGMPLAGGESITVDTTALIQVIAASGTPTVAYYETYD